MACSVLGARKTESYGGDCYEEDGWGAAQGEPFGTGSSLPPSPLPSLQGASSENNHTSISRYNRPVSTEYLDSLVSR